MTSQSTGLEVRVTVNSREVKRLMDLMIARGIDLPLKKLAVIGVRSITRNFHEGGRPEPWPALKFRQGKPLQDTRDMMRKIEPVYLGATNFKIVSGVPYAPFHQFGTKAIPARPFALWQQEDSRLMAEMLRDHLTRGM